MKKRKDIYVGIALILSMALAGCSTTRNTARSRFYHSFTTRYNVYFNGNEAYKEGMLALEEGNKDNYLEPIPLYPIGNAATIGAGKEQFERAIEKSQKAIRQHSIKRKPTRRPGRAYTEEYRRWLARREFNPFLHNAWMLMGKAQFHKGDFVDAVTTFTYMTRLYEGQPKITAEAGVWLARCYTELKWYYEAEDLLKKINNDSLPGNLIPFYSSAYGNLLLAQERYKDATPYLQQAFKTKVSRRQRARQYYLQGQVYQHLDDDAKAYDAFRRVVRMNPPYELEISARIRQTEVMPARNKEKTIGGLRRMAKAEKNKEYLDQIYYALGNIYLASNDTTQAIKEYLAGVEKSTRGGVEKGMLQLKLGNLFWELERYEEAQTAYSDAIGLIDKESGSYAQLNKRSEVLDELVNYAGAIQLQDSLQRLASLGEAERIAVITRMMEEMERKEKEAKEREEQEAKRAGQQQGGAAQPGQPTGTATPTIPTTSQAAASWYFYNPQLVAQGKTAFERTWGRRKAEDNWRRKNKTVVSLDDFEPVNYDADETPPADTLQTSRVADAKRDSIAQPGTAVAGGKDIDFYLKQIPLTEEAMKESNATLSDAIYNLGLLFKDKLENYPRAEAQLLRLVRQFPGFGEMDKALYNLFLMYSRWEKPDVAGQYRNRLIGDFPQSTYARVLADPDFVYHAMYGKHLEDSLYADTYKQYQAGDYGRVATNFRLSSDRYPAGQHRPKFIFLHSMTRLHEGDTKDFLTGLKEIVANYPENEITDLAAHILKGVQQGRVPTGNAHLPSSVWERRRLDTSIDVADTAAIAPFSKERETPYLFILAYEEGTVNENLLLYDLARYNFSSFVVKNFDLEFVRESGIGMLQVRPFVNFNEARQYQHLLYANKEMTAKLEGLRAIVISEENYKLLLEHYSFDEYDRFYREEVATGLLEEMSLDYVEFGEE